VITPLCNLCKTKKDNKEQPNILHTEEITKLPKNINPKESRKYDLVIVGATGFTGKLLCQYYAKTYGLSDTFKWAIAGRSKERL